MFLDGNNRRQTCPALRYFNAAAVIQPNGFKKCKAQESELAVLWTIGVFALNFGPVLVGGVLDLVGPKWTSVLGQ